MSAANTVFTSEKLLEIFPPQRTEDFFDALFGGAEEGAYDIRLAFIGGEGKRLNFGFELHRRADKCLACSLTSGLPPVFARHPVINIKDICARLAELAGWPVQEENGYSWELGDTEQVSAALHIVPLTLVCG